VPILSDSSDLSDSSYKSLSWRELVARAKSTNYFKMKETVKNKIKKWLLGIDRQETLPSDIVALNFNISEPYELELIGSSWYDDEDPDWACDDDFVPDDCFLPLEEIPEEVHWEQALSMITEILKEIVAENSIKLFNVQHIAVGFVDGDLVIVK